MKQFIYPIIALTIIFCSGCANEELIDIQNERTPVISRNAVNIDYNQYTLLEKRTLCQEQGNTTKEL